MDSGRIRTLVVIGLIAVLGTAGVVGVRHLMHTSRVDTAIAEIVEMQVDLDAYYERYGAYALSLEEVGHGGRLDPWGNPYEFLNYDTDPKKKNVRKDKNLKGGLNTGYSLFSAGPDGAWEPDLAAEVSRDDIIRANDGEFVGVAERY